MGLSYLGLSLPPILLLLGMMALVFVLAWPLEWVPIVLIIVLVPSIATWLPNVLFGP